MGAFWGGGLSEAGVGRGGFFRVEEEEYEVEGAGWWRRMVHGVSSKRERVQDIPAGAIAIETDTSPSIETYISLAMRCC